MEETKINFRTKVWVKNEFFKICKDQNVNASARFNDFMRRVIEESGSAESNTQTLKDKEARAMDSWRDDLVST